MINKIVIPVDGSDNSATALKYGIYISPKLNATLLGLHIIDVYLIQGPMLTDISGSVGMPPYYGFFEAVEAPAWLAKPKKILVKLRISSLKKRKAQI